MSFDVYFLPRIEGRTWEEAMDALEEAAAEAPAPLTEAQLVTWERIKAAALEVLPDAEEFIGEFNRELSHDPTGIQVSSYGVELTLTVPYWHSGNESERIVGLLVDLATRIEAATGLIAYDPQGDQPFLDGGSATAAETMDDTREAVFGKPPRSFWSRLFKR